jgi:hypothetical protein
MRMPACLPRAAMLFTAATLFSLSVFADTVTITTAPLSPILEPGEQIIFGTQSPDVSLGSLFDILVEDQAVTTTTSTPNFTLTIADSADNVSATFNGTFEGPSGGGVGGEIIFGGTAEVINGVDFVTVKQGVYTIGLAPTFYLNGDDSTTGFSTTGVAPGGGGGVGKVDLMSGIIVSSVPEPSTCFLAGAGFLLMAGFARRRLTAARQK